MNLKYRDSGAIGAILDEYEKALNELISIIQQLTSAKIAIIVDHKTKDEDCRSIQTILTHVVRAGYGYATYIRNHQGESLSFKKPGHLDSPIEYVETLKEMFRFTEKVFDDYPNLKLEEHQEINKILVNWGQRYDIEQLMEHAIVHILRHRRQIERFIFRIG